MGQSLFLENRGQRLFQVWLLTFCVLLCFQTGDAVKCRLCSSTGPGKPCEPKEKTCTGPFCLKIEIFSGGKWITYVKECGENSSKKLCGTEVTAGEKRKVSCCNSDLCFD